MRSVGKASMLAVVFLGLGALHLAGCGGSASQTPFPPEPNDVDLGPAGEQEKADAPYKRGAPASTVATSPDSEPEPASSGTAAPVAAPPDATPPSATQF